MTNARHDGKNAIGGQKFIVALFFFSGAASLICEVVWFKQLQFILSSSTVAVSIVVACFFGGLASGSAIGGWLADRQSHLLRLYSILECALAIASVALTLFLSHWETWVGWFSPWLKPESLTAGPTMVLISLIVLLGPTALMGATLPVLTRYLVGHRDDLARQVGRLYAFNTLGAACGCALVGFVFIGLFGVIGSALVAATIYASIATVSFVASLRTTPIGPVIAETEDENVESSAAARLLIAVFAVNGFVAIAYEVLWFRVLANFGTHSVFAFSAMLATYLLSLVVGAFICARWLSPHKVHHVAMFARLQLMIAVSAFVSMVLMGRSRNILKYLGDRMQSTGLDDTALAAFVPDLPIFGLTFLVVFIPAVALGVGFPLAAELTASQLGRVGRGVGRLYALNTFGGVLGSLAAGLIGLPLLGSQGTFLFLIGMNLVLYVVVALTQPSMRRQSQYLREWAFTATALVAAALYVGSNYLESAQTKFEGANILAMSESRDATFVVAEYDCPYGPKYQQLLVNGVSYANNSAPGRRYMSCLAHLPTLLHSGEPKTAMVICIGTGTTVGCLSLYPELDDIHAVDISRDVFKFAPHFVPGNHRFFEKSKVKQVAADGRHYLLTSDRKFDVLTFEPPPPNDAGIVNLYSREFYRLAGQRLAADGVLAQWFPLDMEREAAARIMVRSLLDEFPYVMLFIPCRMEGVAIASKMPIKIDIEKLRTRMHRRVIHDDMTEYGLGEPEQLLATFVSAEKQLRCMIGDAPMLTDDRPRIEYYNFYPKRVMRFADLTPFFEPLAPYLTSPAVDPDRFVRERTIVEHIWTAFEHEERGKLEESLQNVKNGQAIDSSNKYLKYLREKLQLDMQMGRDAGTANTAVGPKPNG
jgi:spermidine synthase